MEKEMPKIYFSDHFEVSHKTIEDFGALDISLVCDNPVFVDPFLIFANSKYKEQHDFIIKYLEFLRDKSIADNAPLNDGDFKHYYKFPEVKEVWFGYSVAGNSGLGLGKTFAESLYGNLNKIFSNFGKEKITESAHLEKLCLVEEGIGIDKISDFTLNLIKKYILEYTQKFAQNNIDLKFVKEFAVKKVSFDFETGLWKDQKFKLPFLPSNPKEFVLLVPQDILTKEFTWISKNDFLESNSNIFSSVDNDELRTKFNTFFHNHLLTKLNKKIKPIPDFSKKSKKVALLKTITEYPDVLDYYIKSRELNSKIALTDHVASPEAINFFKDTERIQKEFSTQCFGGMNTIDDCVKRMLFFKKVIESNSKDLQMNGVRLQEKQLQLMFKMVTFGSLFNYDSEVNNGRGPIDFIASMGSGDKVGLEFKLASNTKLKHNLRNQGEVYKNDSNLKLVIKVVFFFSDKELEKANGVLNELGKQVDDHEFFLIDCRKKESASNVK